MDRLHKFIQTTRKPLPVVLGPTASGKTDFSLRLAKYIAALPLSEKQGRKDTDIVNADSRQLYRGLSTGTAKIMPEEMQSIRHYLFDVVDPSEEMTAAQYQRHAMHAIDDVHHRGNIPMLVGGSMLYISSVIDGLSFPASSDEKLREELSKEYDKDEGKSLHARLLALDPETADGIPRQNKPYLLRALELYRLAGKKPSELRMQSPLPYDLFLIGIECPRELLYEKINNRTKELFKKGWIEEVRQLLRQGYSSKDPAMKSHGYKEIIEYLQKGGSQKELTEKISAKTRQYAKRQMTWWKHDQRIFWIKPDVVFP